MLSPEGQRRFEESGFDAADAINPPPTVDALDALGADEVLAKGASQNINRVDPETGLPRPGATGAGAADDTDAMGAIVNTATDKVDDFVRGGADGIDFNFDRPQSGDDVKAMINQAICPKLSDDGQSENLSNDWGVVQPGQPAIPSFASHQVGLFLRRHGGVLLLRRVVGF